MYKVKLMPSKCPNNSSWIKQYKDGDIKDVSDVQYNYHSRHGCMGLWLEHYRIKTISKKKCPKCRQWVIKRKKEKIW